MVLVLVLIVLVASVIIGVTSLKTSNTEIKLAGNERVYIQRFMDTEAACDFAEIVYATAVDTAEVQVANGYDYPEDTLPDNLRGNVDVNLRFSNKSKAPVGYDVTRFERHNYVITSTNVNGSHTVETGGWKIFARGR